MSIAPFIVFGTSCGSFLLYWLTIALRVPSKRGLPFKQRLGLFLTTSKTGSINVGFVPDEKPKKKPLLPLRVASHVMATGFRLCYNVRALLHNVCVGNVHQEGAAPFVDVLVGVNFFYMFHISIDGWALYIHLQVRATLFLMVVHCHM